ncbi:hypothetical protein TNCV_2244331 [Trichonephila clavipes]|nr:hypothetical protein TNCV_2244331 [Trichonephila clavipes]
MQLGFKETISSQTNRNGKHVDSLYARRPKMCNPLTTRHHAPEENGLLNIKTGYRVEKDHRKDEMVWAGIGIKGRIDLNIILTGNLMARRYADEILRLHVIPHAATIGDSLLLM